MSSGSDGVLYGGARRVVRSQAAMPAGPETKSMASRAMAYRSAWAASGVNRSRARQPGPGRGAGTAACDTPRAVTAVVRSGALVIVTVASRPGLRRRG